MYSIPVRRILTEQDLDLFKKSSVKEDILGFIRRLSESVTGFTNDAECATNEVTDSLVKIIGRVAEIVDMYPPKDGSSSRFGKAEFHDFYDRVQSDTMDLLLTVPGLHQDQIVEIGAYFTEAWGNRLRIDYGSGHELNFMVFLLCLEKVGILEPKTFDLALVLRVFREYLQTMRKIQTVYWLEPAGSHGVWGLDDYHFLPFLFGAAQLSTHKHLRPISIHDQDLLEMYGDKYMYLGAIRFINSIKSASLRWHSPMLDDISGVKKWSKVNEGLLKMYDAEVLGKLPVTQHFMFGTLLPAPEGTSQPSGDHDGHVHAHGSWADCCGIRVPSAIAAAAAMAKPIPFD